MICIMLVKVCIFINSTKWRVQSTQVENGLTHKQHRSREFLASCPYKKPLLSEWGSLEKGFETVDKSKRTSQIRPNDKIYTIFHGCVIRTTCLFSFSAAPLTWPGRSHLFLLFSHVCLSVFLQTSGCFWLISHCNLSEPLYQWSATSVLMVPPFHWLAISSVCPECSRG